MLEEKETPVLDQELNDKEVKEETTTQEVVEETKADVKEEAKAEEVVENKNNESKEEREVILEVKNLKQWFKMGSNTLKAVDDVSFKVYKGEVFGLVGESGCGKTTTGRTIIKLYKNTSGDVIYKGQRISAGTQQQKANIKEAKLAYKNKAKEINEKINAEVEKLSVDGAKPSKEDVDAIRAKYQPELDAAKNECDVVVKEMVESIRQAKEDTNHGEKNYAKKQCQAVCDEYDPKIESETDPEKKQALIKEKKEKLRLAKRARMMTTMQMIFQDPIASLDPRMTVKEIISEGLIIRGIRDKKVIDEKVYKVLEYVGLVREHANRYPHEFSGGQRQRIGIARAIIMDPDLIIADEPVSALDVSIQAQVINLLNDLRNDLDLSIIFIAHNLSVVKYFADRIAVMYFGNMVELATSEELFKHPLHPYTKSLLSAIPLPDPNYEKSRVRITYNPLAEHDYSVDKPSFREVYPGHFVKCNEKEYQDILKQLADERQ